MTTFVDVKELKLKLDEHYVLNKINLNLNKGDRCLLVGINGSGKSCLLRTMAGMHIVREGDLIINNKNSFQDQCNGLAFLGESWNRSVAFAGHSIAYQCDIKVKDMMKKVQEENKERKKELEKVLGVNPEWRMHMVSSGQRRRVRLFLGLLKPFNIALLDEMTMDLDIITRVRFMQWLKKESIENKACIIYVTHIFDGLNDWPTHIAHIKHNGILNNTQEVAPNSNIEQICFNLLNDDYLFLEKNNVTEQEEGLGKLEYERSKNKRNGPQGGYGSGRLGNLIYNNEISK